jgi:glutamate--cysteine ligase
MSFAEWIADGHPDFGFPTRADLDYHLTTLFFEVRPRGFLELRAGEALPARLRAALVVLVTALLYDDCARGRALELLESKRSRLPELWQRAARDGVRDPELTVLCPPVWEEALRAAERMPCAYFGEEALQTTREYLERYTARERMPADDLLQLLDEDPARSLVWASAAKCEQE